MHAPYFTDLLSTSLLAENIWDIYGNRCLSYYKLGYHLKKKTTFYVLFTMQTFVFLTDDGWN